MLEASDGEQAMELFYADREIALLILDVMMPKMDGWQVCREVRQTSKVPIIMLTARGEEQDELQGFELGVDEYISKPFSPKILVARVEAILRRTRTLDAGEMADAGGISIDKAAHRVQVDGRDVELSYKEFELLSYCYRRDGNPPLLYSGGGAALPGGGPGPGRGRADRAAGGLSLRGPGPQSGAYQPGGGRHPPGHALRRVPGAGGEIY